MFNYKNILFDDPAFVRQSISDITINGRHYFIKSIDFDTIGKSDIYQNTYVLFKVICTYHHIWIYYDVKLNMIGSFDYIIVINNLYKSRFNNAVDETMRKLINVEHHDV